VTINRYSRYTYYMLAAFVVFLALLWTAKANAQSDTPEPTPTVEPTAAPLPSEPIPADDAAYIETIDRLGRLIETLMTEGGAAALGQAPLWLVIGIAIGIAVAFVYTRLTPTHADDEVFDRLFNRLLKLLNVTVATQRIAEAQSLPRNEGTVTTTTTTTQAPPTDPANGIVPLPDRPA
jgi:ABC-type dipeptide/oligopeptide/nickel transport system permease subunit